MARRSMPPPRRRRRSGWLITLVVLVWMVIGVVVVYRVYLAPRIRDAISAQIQQQIGQAPVSTAPPGASPQPGAPPAINMPGLVAALPSGEFTISEQQINAYLAPKLPGLQPLDTLTVQLIPGEVQLLIGAYGINSTARVGLAVQDGRVLAVNPQMDGPLASLVNLNDIVGPLQQALNQQLDLQGRRINEVRVEQGAITVRVDA
jgi:hypothetical protein